MKVAPATLVLASVLLATAADALGAPVRPPRVPVAASRDTQVSALAGSKLAWISRASGGELNLFWSDGGRPRRLARVTPGDRDYYADWEELSLAGSSRQLAWRRAGFIDNRLSVDDQTDYWIRDHGKNRVYSRCFDGSGNNSGLDVDGRLVAIARGPCNRGDQVTVYDFAGGRGPKVTRITGRYPVGGVRVAGRYVAWQEYEFFIDRLIVWDLKAGRELYRFTPPDEAGLTYDLQADGSLVLTYQPDRTRAVGRLGWVSPQEVAFHQLPGTPDFSGVHAVGGRIAYTRVGVTARQRRFPFVVANMAGELEYEIAAPRRTYLQDFDGTCAAWMDATPQPGRFRTRLLVSPVPARHAVDSASACSFVRLPRAALARRGRVVAVPLQCRTSTQPGCSGRLGATADGGILAGRRSFRLEPGQTRTVLLKVSPRVFRTPHSRRKARLRVWVEADAVRGIRAVAKRTTFVRQAPVRAASSR